MASRTATVQALEILRGPDDVGPSDTLGGLRRGVLWLWNNTASTVAGGTDTLDCVANTTIAAWLRNGKTITVRYVAMFSNATVGAVSYAASVALSTQTVQITPKSEADYSTNATLPANTTATVRPYGVLVVWTES